MLLSFSLPECTLGDSAILSYIENDKIYRHGVGFGWVWFGLVWFGLVPGVFLATLVES